MLLAALALPHIRKLTPGFYDSWLNLRSLFVEMIAAEVGKTFVSSLGERRFSVQRRLLQRKLASAQSASISRRRERMARYCGLALTPPHCQCVTPGRPQSVARTSRGGAALRGQGNEENKRHWCVQP